jgi:hypothetical protein
MNLRIKLLEDYREKYLSKHLKALIYSPVSGAWKYIFPSWKQCLDHMGIDTSIIYNSNDGQPANYHIFISIADFRWMNDRFKNIYYKIGIASKEDTFINSSDCTQLDLDNIRMAKEFGYNVLVAAANKQWTDIILKQWIDNGINIHNGLFGFNPTIHYRGFWGERYDWFFAGTNTGPRVEQTMKYFSKIIPNYPGELRGTLWGGPIQEIAPGDCRNFYHNTKINLNCHGEWQRAYDNEINDRTFQIAGCGAFQLIDNPKALNRYFTDKDMAIASDPNEYFEKFKYYLNKPLERAEMAYNSYVRSYESNYSLFDRLEGILWKDGTL